MEMHTLLSSALESSTKNKEQLNTLKAKLVDSENLIAALTKKVKSRFINSNKYKYFVLYFFFVFRILKNLKS